MIDETQPNSLSAIVFLNYKQNALLCDVFG